MKGILLQDSYLRRIVEQGVQILRRCRSPVKFSPEMIMESGYLRVQHQSTPLPFRPHIFQRDR
jgi:hypothetical protein